MVRPNPDQQVLTSQPQPAQSGNTARPGVRPNPDEQIATGATASIGARSVVVSGAGHGPVRAPATAVRVLAPSSGFDWGDAGIGAGSALVLTIIGVGGVLTATSRRRRRNHNQPVSATS
jgi:hypothetical protein